MSETLAPLAGKVVFGNPEATFKTYCIDSRFVSPDTLFVPLLGQRRDGHHYVLDAFNKGASVALVKDGHHLVVEILRALQESHSYVSAQVAHDVTVVEVRHTLVALQKLASWFRRQFEDLSVIGITGSVGKTQTKEMLLSLLSGNCSVVGTDKNFNNEIGVPLTLAKLRPETRYAVVEMAMRGRGEISLLSRIAQPTVSLVTNTLGSHIGRLGSGAEVARAKAEIIDGMKAGSSLWLNAHDHNLGTLLHEIEEKQAVKRGLKLNYFDVSAATASIPPLLGLSIPGEEEASEQHPLPAIEPALRVGEVELRGLSGSRFNLHVPEHRLPVTLNVPGRGAVENFVCAAALAHDCGFSYGDIAQLAANIEPTPQRLTPYELQPGVALIDDTYNSGPASVQDAVEIVAQFPPQTRRIVVLGDMLELGKFEILLHRQAARQVYSLPTSLVIGIGPRMGALHEVPVPEEFELLWFHGRREEDERIAQGFAPAQRPPKAHDSVEMVDKATIERVSQRILEEIDHYGQNMVILVKGSRALHLGRLVRNLLSYYGKEERIL